MQPRRTFLTSIIGLVSGFFIGKPPQVAAKTTATPTKLTAEVTTMVAGVEFWRAVDVQTKEFSFTELITALNKVNSAPIPKSYQSTDTYLPGELVLDQIVWHKVLGQPHNIQMSLYYGFAGNKSHFECKILNGQWVNGEWRPDNDGAL